MTVGALVAFALGVVAMWLLGPDAGVPAALVIVLAGIALGHGIDRARRERRGLDGEDPE